MKLILCSNSPRRKELLAGLDIPFDVRVKTGISESCPAGLSPVEVAKHIAMQKSEAYEPETADEVILTADTIVVCGEDILGKPADEADACRMLQRLSGRTHQVVTGVALKSRKALRVFAVVTNVTFKALTAQEITYYVRHYRPFDKAGAYGIQEWIGYIGVTRLEGSYFNVMGLPVQRIYEELKKLPI